MRPHGPSSPVEAENQHSRCSRPTSERREPSSAWPSCLAVTRKCPQGMDDGCGSRVADANGGSNKRGLSPDLVVADEQRRGRVAVPLNAAMRLDSIPVGVDREGGAIVGAVAWRSLSEICRRAWALARVEWNPAVWAGGPAKAALRWGAPLVLERRRLSRRHGGRFHTSSCVWQPLRQAPSERTMSRNATKSRSRCQGERVPWTSDCTASMRS